jgi:hypothetical protein
MAKTEQLIQVEVVVEYEMCIMVLLLTLVQVMVVQV